MKKAPSLSDLEYFLTIVGTGSLSAAAKQLRVQQSTLTIALQRLESLVGKALLVRERRGVIPTRSGQVFVGKAKELVEKWRELSGENSLPTVMRRERFSIGCHQSTGLYTLKRFLPALLSKYPAIEVTVEHSYAHDAVEGVLRNRIDFAIVVNPIQHQDLDVFSLYPTYIGLWSSESAEKLNCDVLFFDPKMYSVENILGNLKEGEFASSRKLPVGSLDTIASLVVAGAGRGIMPADTACGQGGPLLKLLWEPKQAQPLIVSLVSRKDSQTSALAREVREEIKNGLRGIVPGKKYPRPGFKKKGQRK